jgi:hypothetical protein
MSGYNEEREDQRNSDVVSPVRPAAASEFAVWLSMSRQFKAKLDRLWLATGPGVPVYEKIGVLRYRLELAMESALKMQGDADVLALISLKVSPNRSSLNAEKRMDKHEQIHRWKCYRDERYPWHQDVGPLEDEDGLFHDWVEAGCPEWEGGARG